MLRVVFSRFGSSTRGELGKRAAFGEGFRLGIQGAMRDPR